MPERSPIVIRVRGYSTHRLTLETFQTPWDGFRAVSVAQRGYAAPCGRQRRFALEVRGMKD